MEHILKHQYNNPRNSEGAFVKLADGTLYFAYTRYNSDSAGDHAPADIAAVVSKDNGKSWGEPFTVIRNRRMNVMSTSLLRLQNGRIALVYIEKSAVPGRENFVDCRPWIVFSDDETRSWSAPVEIADMPAAYFVVNNDRLVQLADGRLILPAAHHQYGNNGKLGEGIIRFFISDDQGLSWRLGNHCIYPMPQMPRGFMEPGIIELKNNRLMCFIRTAAGCQYKSFSCDNGESWTPAVPAVEFISPEASISIKRDPSSGKLYAVWNDQHALRCVRSSDLRWKRTPLVMAESSDEGISWVNHRILEDAPDHGYCYTAMFFNGDWLHLGYCCGGEPDSDNSLEDTKLRGIRLDNNAESMK